MLTVVVLVAQPANGDGRSVDDALRKAARDTLGPNTTVDVRDVAELPDDAAAESLGRDVGAGAVVEIAWRDAAMRSATIRVRVGTAEWLDREIGFAPSDADNEEGRTLGFAIASMIPEGLARPASPPPPSSLPPIAVGSPIAPGPPVAHERLAPHDPGNYVGALEINGVAAQALGGYGGGAGGAAAVHLYLSPHFAFRAGGGARVGEVGPAQATLRTFVMSTGIAWRSGSATRAAPFSIGVRTDFLVAYESVTHLSPDDPQRVREGTWVPGADLMLEGSWLFAEGAAGVLSVGGEAFFGSSDIFVHDRLVTSLVPLHLLAEVGLRTRF